jgi:hypothetical protein
VLFLRPCTRHTSAGQHSAQWLIKGCDGYAGGQIEQGCAVEAEDVSGPSAFGGLAGAHAICSSLVQFQQCRSRDSELLLLLRLALLTQTLTVCLCPSSAWRVCYPVPRASIEPSIRSFIRYSSHSSNPFPSNLRPNPHISSRGSESESNRLAASSPPLLPPLPFLVSRQPLRQNLSP